MEGENDGGIFLDYSGLVPSQLNVVGIGCVDGAPLACRDELERLLRRRWHRLHRGEASQGDSQDGKKLGEHGSGGRRTLGGAENAGKNWRKERGRRHHFRIRGILGGRPINISSSSLVQAMKPRHLHGIGSMGRDRERGRWPKKEVSVSPRATRSCRTQDAGRSTAAPLSIPSGINPAPWSALL